jgi:tetratricopeptide (TPR) repeat protein
MENPDVDLPMPPLVDPPSSTNDAEASSTNEATSSDSDDDSVPGLEETSAPATAKAEAAVLKAVALKEEGNAHLKAADLDKAVRAYRKGTNALKGLNEDNTGDDQVKALLISLANNMAMVLGKQAKWGECIKVSKTALQVDASNLKALYRTAVAQRETGALDESRGTLKRALEIDSNSRECKLELAKVKKAIDDAKKKERAVFGGAFDKGTGGLYEDREEEMKAKRMKKLEDERKEKLKKENEEKKEKKDWEDECVSRMAKSEPPVSFDDWKAEKDAVKKAEEDKKKKEEEERARKKREEKKAKKHEVVKVDGDSSDDDIGNLKGYKLTSDGRKTSFFNNELTEEQKGLIGDITPKAIEVASIPEAPQRISSEQGASAWNKAGTWEEKDTSEWCRTTLTELLGDVDHEGDTLSAKVTKVDDMAGDSSVVVVAGKKRYVFDITCVLPFEVCAVDKEGKAVGKGKLKLHDISSTAAADGEWEVEVEWKKGSGDAGVKEIVVKQLVEGVKQALSTFVQRFNSQY